MDDFAADVPASKTKTPSVSPHTIQTKLSLYSLTSGVALLRYALIGFGNLTRTRSSHRNLGLTLQSSSDHAGKRRAIMTTLCNYNSIWLQYQCLAASKELQVRHLMLKVTRELSSTGSLRVQQSTPGQLQERSPPLMI
ncbi:hypothetical protein SCHPADRAFT_902795 [Schizopora paradoxa]|uniref:Uncharacterized protein n=1 Tax=Schizopora paradoxa TaxID=27342 RepID=A0A0H2RSU5_9AGAM|nr:hypothetical protein SCHPADRAFT_902795 [Schizopora paradoxa]